MFRKDWIHEHSDTAGWMLDEHLEAEMFQDTLAINQLLCQETSGGKHAKTSILEFLCLKDLQLFRIGWFEVEGIKANVTRGVVCTQETGLVYGGITRGHPTVLGTVELDLGDAKGKEKPERSRRLEKVGDSGSLYGSIEEEGRSFDLLADKESNHSQHTNTSMGELGLAVTLEGVLVSFLGEAKGVEETYRGESTSDVINRVLRKKE
jgi:hypothetical protein